MKNHKLLLKLLQQPSNQGITLTELLVALVVSGIVLTATASGFMNVLRANRDVDSKGNQLSNLTRALTFIQEDIKEGVSVRRVANGTGNCTSGVGGVDSDCLMIRLSDGNEIYYGFKDISGDTSPFLKPGILKRQEYDDSGDALDYEGNTLPSSDPQEQQTAWQEQFTIVADGLEIDNSPSHNAPNPTCNDGGSGSIAWVGTTTVRGINNTGFRFCLNDDTANNRLVRIFLYGHIIGSNNAPMNVDVVTFARSE